MCKCLEQRILAPGTVTHFALEVWCSTHGYQTNCAQCQPELSTTDRCVRHRSSAGGVVHTPFELRADTLDVAALDRWIEETLVPILRDLAHRVLRVNAGRGGATG